MNVKAATRKIDLVEVDIQDKALPMTPQPRGILSRTTRASYGDLSGLLIVRRMHRSPREPHDGMTKAELVYGVPPRLRVVADTLGKESQLTTLVQPSQ